jgi:hypothetical protein
MVALLTVPVSADQSGTATITGTLPQVLSLTVINPTQSLNLNPGTTATNSNVGLSVQSPSPFSITVADSSARNLGEEVAPHAGFMTNATGNVYAVYPLDQALASPLQLIVPASATYVSTTVTGTSTSATTGIPVAGEGLYSGNGGINGRILPLTLSQPVSNSDTVLPTSSNYRIDLLFTIETT